MSRYLVPLILAVFVAAEQPGSRAPLSGPQRKLPFGQLNFLHTTDVHGWHAGHFDDGKYSADYGDYISFIQRMREKTDAAGTDLLVIDTGDRVEGNGLYDGSSPKGLYTYDVIKKLDFDVLIPGNHELYVNYVVDDEYSKVSKFYKEKYLASNVDYIDPKTGKQVPLGQRYRVFRTKNQGIRVAAFGFLFNFVMNSNNSVVQRVEEAVKEDWFQAAIREDVDLFLVCGHIPAVGSEFKVIVEAIRSQKKDVPIHTFGAHTHIRNHVQFDSKAFGLQSGRYFETVGWASIDGLKKNDDESGQKKQVRFRRRYIDNNIYGYRFHTGLNATEFPTEYGKNVSKFIENARKSLDLDYVYGCIPRDLLYFGSMYPRDDSISTWIIKDLLPDVVARNPFGTNASTLILMNRGFFRSDLVKGPFTRDTTYVLTPFEDSFLYIKDVPYRIAKRVNFLLTKDPTILEQSERKAPTVVKEETPLQSRHFSSKLIPRNLEKDGSETSQLLSPQVPPPGYTTVDVSGSDGDDTLHSPLPRFQHQAEVVYARVHYPSDRDPETVDIVFNKYIQKVILELVADGGIQVNTSAIQLFREEPIRDIVAQWIKENWRDDC